MTKVTVKCLSCGAWVLRGEFEGTVELNCSQQSCRTGLLVTISDGKPRVEVVDKPAARPVDKVG